MWVTEAVPLWVTSLSIPFLTVLGRVGVDDDLTPKEISQKAIKVFYSSGVMNAIGIVIFLKHENLQIVK